MKDSDEGWNKNLKSYFLGFLDKGFGTDFALEDFNTTMVFLFLIMVEM